MGDKPLLDDMGNRFTRAFTAAHDNNITGIEVLTGEKGYQKIINLAAFAVNTYHDVPRYNGGQINGSMNSERYGKLRGRIWGANVYTPHGFSNDIIEIKDTKGEFSYTIDLSDE